MIHVWQYQEYLTKVTILVTDSIKIVAAALNPYTVFHLIGKF